MRIQHFYSLLEADAFVLSVAPSNPIVASLELKVASSGSKVVPSPYQKSLARAGIFSPVTYLSFERFSVLMVTPLQISFPIPDQVQRQADGSCPFNLTFPDILHGDLITDFKSIPLAELMIALRSRVIR